MQELAFRKDGELVLWDEKSYMLADLIDEMRTNNFILQILIGSKPKNPKHAWRPKGKTEEKSEETPSGFSSDEQIYAFIEAFKPDAYIPD